MRVHDELVCQFCGADAARIRQEAEATVTVHGYRKARPEMVDGQVVAQPRGSWDTEDDVFGSDLEHYDRAWFRCSACDADADHIAELVGRRVEWELGDGFNLPDGRTVRVMGIRSEDRRESELAPAAPVTEVLLDGEWWDVRDYRLEMWTPNPHQLELLAAAA